MADQAAKINMKKQTKHTMVHCLTLCSKLPHTKHGFLRLAAVQLTAACPSSPQL